MTTVLNDDSRPLYFSFEPRQQVVEGSVVRIVAHDGSSEVPCWFVTKDANLTLCNEALFCLGLLPAMKMQRDLHIEGSLDAKLYDALPRLQDIYGIWEPTYRRTQLSGAARSLSAPSLGLGVGTFFTGGVDSYYTLIKHQSELTHIIYVHGIDVGLADKRLRAQVSAMLERVGNDFGVKVIELESNLRGYFEDFGLEWGRHAFGPALIAVAHLLAPDLRKIYVPSTFTYAELIPVGSHPLVDPLWSSSRLEVVHDGCEATRIMKVQKLATSQTAMETLRVCFNNVDSNYNCGKCEKCFRTMVNLKAAGALERCTTFPGTIDLRALRRMSVIEEYERAMMLQNLRALEGQPAERQLYDALNKILKRPVWQSRVNEEFWRRIRVWRRSVRRRLGLEKKYSQFELGGNDVQPPQ